MGDLLPLPRRPDLSPCLVGNRTHTRRRSADPSSKVQDFPPKDWPFDQDLRAARARREHLGARPDHDHNSRTACSLWAVAPSEKGSIDTAALKRLRAEGINALVVDAQSSRVGRVLALHTLVRQMKMWLVVVVPRGSQTPAARRALSLCRGTRPTFAAPGSRRHSAERERWRTTPTVFGRSLRSMRQAPRRCRNSRRWDPRDATCGDRPALQELQQFRSGVARSESCDLAGRRPCGRSVASLSSRSSRASAPRSPPGRQSPEPRPTSPRRAHQGVALKTVTASSATVSWLPSVDDVGVSGYRVYVGGSLVQSTSATRTTLSGLTCGAAATIAVDAVDASGNASARSAVTATPGPCGGGGGGRRARRRAPSASRSPASLRRLRSSRGQRLPTTAAFPATGCTSARRRLRRSRA